MNKKYMVFAFSVLTLALITAGVIQYFGQVQQDVTVDQAIVFTGDNTADATISGGESVTSDDLLVESQTSVVVPLSISTTADPNEAGITHHTNYLLDNSGGSCPGADCEKRIFISSEDAGVSTLSDLVSMSWDVNAIQGYLSHVDILIDTTGDGLADDALVFEYAKVTTANCDNAPYPLGELDTFGDKGILTTSSYAWLTTGPAGGCASPPTSFFWHSLSDWITGVPSNEANGKTIDGSTKVIGFDLEVDNWVSSSNSIVSDIEINGNPVEVSLKPGDDLGFNVETTFGFLNVGNYTITTTIEPRV